jgi:hypothetical protein
LYGTGSTPVAVADDEVGRAVPVVVDGLDVISRAVEDPHAASVEAQGKGLSKKVVGIVFAVRSFLSNDEDVAQFVAVEVSGREALTLGQRE